MENIPTTVVNGRQACVGVLAEAEFVQQVLAVATASAAARAFTAP